MTKEERKYVDLFCRIKQNDTVIPYEDSMEVMIMPKINRGFYMDHWKSYLASQRRHLGDGYDEWFENLESADEIEETYRRDLPSKMIEVSYGNEEIFVNEIRNAFVTFMDDIRGLVRPAANTDIGAFYEINPGGFTLAVLSFCQIFNNVEPISKSGFLTTLAVALLTPAGGNHFWESTLLSRLERNVYKKI